MKANINILHEITPLSQSDCLYVIERNKVDFNYPIHTHDEFEINYIEGACGAERIVGDSIEEIGDYEMIMISSENLEHGWRNHDLKPGNIHEITIQFSKDWLSDELLDKNQFSSIKNMLRLGEKGACFSLPTIMKIRPLIKSLSNERNGFYSVVTFLSLLYEMSLASDTRTLASSCFARSNINEPSHRIQLVDDYIRKNYNRNITRDEVANLTNMSEGAFSRFFKLRTGRSFSEYLIDTRIGTASRMLIDTNKTVAEIAYDCGYNNISNFNRIFKNKKGVTPSEFKEIYHKNKMIF